MGWKIWRPAIWLAMLGIAVGVIVNPYVGVLIIGGALGITAKIARGRNRN